MVEAISFKLFDNCCTVTMETIIVVVVVVEMSGREGLGSK